MLAKPNLRSCIDFALMMLLCCALARTSSAQAKAAPLQAGAVATIVERLITGLDGYVFPERALILKSYLHAHLGQYQQIQSPQALADRLTTDLRTVGQDKHLTNFYAPSMPGNDTQGATQERMHKLMEAQAFGATNVTRLPSNIRYLGLDFLAGSLEASRVAAMTLLQGSDALIIDLRTNHDGSPDVDDQRISYFVSGRTQLTAIVLHDRGATHLDEQWTSADVSGADFCVSRFTFLPAQAPSLPADSSVTT